MTVSIDDYPLLAQVPDPEALRALPAHRLPALAKELRHYLLHSVARSGGHLAAGLGAVELTLALHYVFNTPEDRLVWDVGHQCYPHKILTGRRERLGTIRKYGGLAGFPKRAESPYDTFGVGHSSTSISAALGMALAARQAGEHRKAVAIIGDGGMTAGEAFEAMNHAGDAGADLLVVLNDNEMSISENVGALSQHLTRILSGRWYHQLRSGSKEVLRRLPPPVHELARRTEEHLKGMVVPGTLFEELGFQYFGPVDGHNVDALVEVLGNLARQRGPRLLHVVTCKGKGYRPAERDPIAYHGVSQFDPEQGLPQKAGGGALAYNQVFGRWLCAMAEQDPRLVAITPAMREGSGMVEYAQRFPERYHDVGIAEQHAVTLAAGLACESVKPVLAIYSTFLQRGYDQLVHDVALQDLPVLFAVDRAGLVGADGPTHHGSLDLSYLRCVPNMTIAAPSDEAECWRLLSTGYHHDGPFAVRYPRGSGPGAPLPEGDLSPLPIGKGVCRRRGQRMAVLAFGTLVTPALAAAEALDLTLADMRFVRPLDEALIQELADSHELLVTVEENAVAGGAGAGVSEYLARASLDIPVRHLGLPDRFVDHGSPGELLAEVGLDESGLRDRLQALLDTLPGVSR